VITDPAQHRAIEFRNELNLISRSVPAELDAHWSWTTPRPTRHPRSTAGLVTELLGQSRRLVVYRS
jgi:hypothetical protein